MSHYDEIIKAIIPINNRYRDNQSSTREKLAALWEIGDTLVSKCVERPHAFGWLVQRQTRGLIKRPTIFRSHKIRSIWKSKEQFLRVLGNLHGLSNLTEMLPLLDPAQRVRGRLSGPEIDDLCRHACSDAPAQFRIYVSGIKQKYSHGRLGQTLDKSKHLRDLHSIVAEFRKLLGHFIALINLPQSGQRQLFRDGTSVEEMQAFSNMCIALTTKDNLSLYRKLGPPTSTSRNEQFRKLYDRCYMMLQVKGDTERARLRRLIAAETFAQMSDLVSSLATEDGVLDFRARQKIMIRLYSGGGSVP